MSRGREAGPRGWLAAAWRSSTQRVMSITSLGLLVALALDVLLATRFGAGDRTDAFVVALSLPLLIDTVTREGSKFGLVALFREHRSENDESEYQRFVSSLVNSAFGIGLLLALAVVAAASPIVTALGPGLTAAAHAEATGLLRVASPLLPFALAATVLGAFLNSERRFALVAARSALAPVVASATLAVAWRRDDAILWVTAAYTVGFAAFFVLLARGAARAGLGYVASFRPADLSRLGRTVLFPSGGVVVRQLSRIAERAIASLVMPGGLSAYYFAFRVLSGLQTVIGTSAATTSLPVLTDAVLFGRREEAVRKLRAGLVRTALLAGVSTVLVLLLHEQLIRLIYGRGAFEEGSIDRTSEVLLWRSLGLVFSCSVPVLASGLYAQRRFAWVFRHMTIAAVFNVVLAWFFGRQWGLAGIAGASALAAVFSASVQLWLLQRSGLSPLRRAARP